MAEANRCTAVKQRVSIMRATTTANEAYSAGHEGEKTDQAAVYRLVMKVLARRIDQTLLVPNERLSRETQRKLLPAIREVVLSSGAGLQFATRCSGTWRYCQDAPFLVT